MIGFGSLLSASVYFLDQGCQNEFKKKEKVRKETEMAKWYNTFWPRQNVELFMRRTKLSELSS